MSMIVRGVKNAFRSGIRTFAVVLILAISMGLALSMLLANQAVKEKIDHVKQQVGTKVLINPAGSMGMEGGGEPLKTDKVAPVKNIAHVKELTMVLSLMLMTEGGPDMQFKPMGGGGLKAGETNLKAATKAGTIGKRVQVRGGGIAESTAPDDILLPIRMTGISGSKDEMGNPLALTAGRSFVTGDNNHAIVGKDLAEKNSLALNSTFKAYGETFTVVGIFDTGTQFGNDALYMPLETAQRLSEAGTEITNAVATVDSVDNVESTAAAMKTTLGKDVADVTVQEENAMAAVEGLRSVEKVSLIGFVIALGAAGVIIFLTMLMIVRERRREIGVLKAIGGSNRTIVGQFVVEAVVLVVLGATVGMGVAAASSNGIANALVTSNNSAATSPEEDMAGPRGGSFKAIRIGMDGRPEIESAKELVGNITTHVSLKTLGYGLLAALFIAVVGSAIPAWFITKVRPAEVLRGE